MDFTSSQLDSIRLPDGYSKIYKEECCVSYDTQESPDGLYVDLHSFLAFGKDFVTWNYEKSGQSVYLHLKRVKEVNDSGERPHKKPTRLAIGVEGGFQASDDAEYKEEQSIVVLPSFTKIALSNENLPDKIALCVSGVLSASSAEREQQVASWVAEQRPVSVHAADLMQLSNGVVVPPSGWRCAHPLCDKTDNLWLNLSDGAVLCGRRNWDGSGGNNHAAEHYSATQYPLAVKLGTITDNLEAADVYSYPEDSAVVDPLLAQHLAHFGIDFSALEKTEMTTAEREVDQNLSFDWNRIQEAGRELVPLYGPGYTGMDNLGNSCYMASVLQAMLATHDWQQRYYTEQPLKAAFLAAPHDPTTDLHFQIIKLAHGLLSGRYSGPPHTTQHVAPRMFKAVIGRGHPEFSTPKQQDALEFYQYLLEQLDSSGRPASRPLPSAPFTLRMEERLQCSASGRVRLTQRTDNVLSLTLDVTTMASAAATAADLQQQVPGDISHGTQACEPAAINSVQLPPAPAAPEVVRPVIPLLAALQQFGAPEDVHGFYSSAIKAHTTAIKSTRVASWPNILVLHVKKYVFSHGWVPHKLDVLLDVPDELDLSFLNSEGLQPGEELLLEEEEVVAPSPSALSPSAAVVDQLMAMGFPRTRSEKAAVLTANAGVEEAMNWLIAHMEDEGIDDPLPATHLPLSKPATPQLNVDESKLAMLLSFGFTETMAHNALRATGGDVEAAAEWIFNNPSAAEQSVDADILHTGSTGVGKPLAGVVPSTEPIPGRVPRYKLLAFVSHMGANTQCGHYVCHVKKEGRWVIFNDAKVAISTDVPKDMGYMYFYQFIDM